MDDPNTQHPSSPNQHQEHSAPGQAPTEGQHAAEGQNESVFVKLLEQLGDHHEITVGPVHLFDLPVILIDNGLHVYPSIESMEEGGEFVFEHHHILRAETHTPPMLDMSITSLIAFQWFSMVLMAAIFIPMARKYKKNGVKPLKGFFNAVESIVVYVRDEVVLPNVGEDGRKLLPIFLTFFFFILVMNLIGLVPGGHSATGSLNVTAGLAIVAFFVIQLGAISKIGIGGWLKHLTGGVPWWLWMIMIPVEVLGLFTKPFALCVRLFANMTAGHVILLSLIGLIFLSQVFIPVTIGFSLFINILELLVAFIQAYIFTMLTAVFTGIGMASHDHDHGHGDEAHATAH